MLKSGYGQATNEKHDAKEDKPDYSAHHGIVADSVEDAALNERRQHVTKYNNRKQGVDDGYANQPSANPVLHIDTLRVESDF